MWERLKEWRLRRTAAGVQDDGAPLDDYVAGYEDEGGENITAIIAGKLAMLSFADSALTVEDRSCPDAPGARVRLIRDLLTELWRCDAGWITAQMLGKGGKLLLPSYDGGSLHIRAIDQSRMAIRRMDGNRIASATLLADVDQLRDRECFLLADYELSGGDQRIRYRAVRSDGVALIPRKKNSIWTTTPWMIPTVTMRRILKVLLPTGRITAGIPLILIWKRPTLWICSTAF